MCVTRPVRPRHRPKHADPSDDAWVRPDGHGDARSSDGPEKGPGAAEKALSVVMSGDEQADYSLSH